MTVLPGQCGAGGELTTKVSTNSTRGGGDVAPALYWSLNSMRGSGDLAGEGVAAVEQRPTERRLVPRRMISRAMVSPSARLNPSIAPLTYPDIPNGRTVVRTTSQRVVRPAPARPRSDPSAWILNTLAVTAVMIGRIITASTMPAVKIAAAGHRGVAGGEQEHPPEVLVEPQGQRFEHRRQDVETPRRRR